MQQLESPCVLEAEPTFWNRSITENNYQKCLEENIRHICRSNQCQFYYNDNTKHYCISIDTKDSLYCVFYCIHYQHLTCSIMASSHLSCLPFLFSSIGSWIISWNYSKMLLADHVREGKVLSTCQIAKQWYRLFQNHN